MNNQKVDVIVIGAGLLGLSTTAAVSEAGKTVLVLESQPVLHHGLGSSRAHSRITPTLASETPVFAKMGKASREAMRQIGALLCDAKGLFIVRKDSIASEGLRGELERALRVRPREFTSEDIEAAFGVTMRSGEICFVDETAGTFDPFVVLDVLHDEIAGRPGNETRQGAQVSAWSAEMDHVRVETAQGYSSMRTSDQTIADLSRLAPS